jgi:SH3 domain protein
MIRKFLLGLALFTNCALLSAQEVTDQKPVDEDKDRQYVTDQLRLSLYEGASSQSEVIKLLQSGDLLEIEQLQGPYALVTTPDGTRGWVKRGFLVTKPTSNLLLRQEQEKTQSLAAEIEKLSNSKVIIDQYEKDMDKLVEKIDTLEAEKQQASEAITDLQQLVEAKQLEIDLKQQNSVPALIVLMDTFKKYWEILVPIILVIMLLSFLVSKGIVEARIRSKFHGIKIW